MEYNKNVSLAWFGLGRRPESGRACVRRCDFIKETRGGDRHKTLDHDERQPHQTKSLMQEVLRDGRTIDPVLTAFVVSFSCLFWTNKG